MSIAKGQYKWTVIQENSNGRVIDVHCRKTTKMDIKKNHLGEVEWESDNICPLRKKYSRTRDYEAQNFDDAL